MINKLLILLCLCLSFFGLAACSSYDFDSQDAGIQNGMHTVRMSLEGGISSYEGVGSRAAVAIPDGAKFYIKFANSISGTAVYHSAENEWSLSYSGSLPAGTKTCSVYYIENPESATDTEVKLKPNSAVYTTTQGSYTVSNDGSITVKATLTPSLARIRFKGAEGTSLVIEGVNRLASFNVSSKIFSSTPESTLFTVANSGYTDYLYYLNPSTTLTLTIGAKQFKKNNVLKSAVASYYISLPTEANHSGWTMTDRPAAVPTAVDLGLSVKWATFNVGAHYPGEYGDYYAWGETDPKAAYDWSTYKWCNGSGTTMTKYCTSSDYGTVDNKTQLDPEDDVAHVKWGGSWRMPTSAEQDDLCTKCTWTWTTQNGVNGYKVTSKTNGNSIFLPAAGYNIEGSLIDAGSYGHYRSSSLSGRISGSAYVLYFRSGYFARNEWGRVTGQSVRPVCP